MTIAKLILTMWYIAGEFIGDFCESSSSVVSHREKWERVYVFVLDFNVLVSAKVSQTSEPIIGILFCRLKERHTIKYISGRP